MGGKEVFEVGVETDAVVREEVAVPPRRSLQYRSRQEGEEKEGRRTLEDDGER
jgi:hypothetical protein